MLVFSLYLAGSVVLLLLALRAMLRALANGESWCEHGAFALASLLFIAGGIMGLVQ